MILIQKGDNYIFATSLFDGAQDKFIKLELINPITGLLQSTSTITHTVSGVYIKNDLPANSPGYLLAKYTVYKDSLLTNEDKRYNQKLSILRVENYLESINENIDDSDGRLS